MNNDGVNSDLFPGDLFDSSEGQSDELLELIQVRVSELMAENPGLLFSYLYRLDINEKKLKSTLEEAEDITLHIAKLILERQLLRVRLRKEFGTDQSNWKDKELS